MTQTKPQSAKDVVAPKVTDPLVPPVATPPATGIGVIGFVTGQGSGPKPTGKGRKP